MQQTKILKLDRAGNPIRWISWRAGALLYCRGQVAWEAGETLVRGYGGFNRRAGRRSFLDVNSIVAVRSLSPQALDLIPPLTKRGLIARDGGMCLYCGTSLPRKHLTCDHVQPLSAGGTDTWENAVSACKVCNQRKGARTPEQAGMKLLALPYAPNLSEGLILDNRHILADQMAFLKATAGNRVPS